MTTMMTMTNRTIALLVLTAWSLAPAAVVSEAQDAPVDVTGKWLFDVVTDAGGGMPVVIFEMDEENQVKGHYSSETLGEADLTGTVMGEDLRFTFEADLQGFPAQVTYVAKIEDNDSLRGTIDIAGAISGTFTGKRQPEDPE
jgi:hypothetical protein